MACDVSRARLDEAARRSPGVQVTENLDDVLAHPEIEAVVVAVDATRHFEVASRVLLAGKHCMVEKPMTTTLAEATELRDLARKSARLLMVGHVFRHNAAINYVRDMLSRGEIGDVLYMYFTRTNLGPIRRDVNAVWDLMSHDLSILMHFMNMQPDWVSAQGASYLTPGCEDVAFATLGYDSGLVANMRVSWLDPRKVREITIVGSNKMVVIDDLSGEPVRIYDKGALMEPAYGSFGEFKLVTRTGAVVAPAIAPSEPLKTQCQHFLEALRTGELVLGDAEDGIRVVRLLAAVDTSIAGNGAVVRIDSGEGAAVPG